MNDLRYIVASVELKKIPLTSWPHIWCELNKWNIPDELEHLKPDGWVNGVSRSRDFVTPFMDVITKIIPEVILSWEWNKYCMTPEQHWEFWEQGCGQIRRREYPYEWKAMVDRDQMRKEYLGGISKWLEPL